MIKYTINSFAKLDNPHCRVRLHFEVREGQFQVGVLPVEGTKIMIINKFYTTEGKINTYWTS